jgi:hypothetical protein
LPFGLAHEQLERDDERFGVVRARRHLDHSLRFDVLMHCLKLLSKSLS